MIDPNTLSKEQSELWEDLRAGEVMPSGKQTLEEAQQAQEAAFRYACGLEGAPLGEGV